MRVWCPLFQLWISHALLDFTWAEHDASAQFLNCIIQGQFDGAVIFDNAQLRPSGSLTGQHSMVHELWGRVGEHAWEVCI